jgi:hypothetical protein
MELSCAVADGALEVDDDRDSFDHHEWDDEQVAEWLDWEHDRLCEIATDELRGSKSMPWFIEARATDIMVDSGLRTEARTALGVARKRHARGVLSTTAHHIDLVSVTASRVRHRTAPRAGRTRRTAATANTTGSRGSPERPRRSSGVALALLNGRAS